MMCRLLAFSFTEKTDKAERLGYINSFRRLSETGTVLRDSTSGHPDGWGIVTYTYDSLIPQLYKSTAPALTDRNFDGHTFLKDETSLSGLAHLRKKTVGELSLVNTHPFSEGEYSFIHNGTVTKEDAGPHSDICDSCEGSTDSERLFRKFLHIKKTQNLPTLEAYVKMLHETTATYTDYSAVNTILHDGEKIYVSRVINKSHPMYESHTMEDYYTLYVGSNSRGDRAVSSEVLPHPDMTYVLLPNHSLCIIDVPSGEMMTVAL